MTTHDDETCGYDAMRNAGLSPRRVDYWTRRGYLRANQPHPGNGYHRTWPTTELAVAAAMVQLVRAGLSPGAAHTVARGQPQLTPAVRVVFDPDGDP